jgi:large subunit ribosomal protein L29
MSKKIDFNRSLSEIASDDLKARISEDEVRIKKLGFAHAITPLENPMASRAMRKDLARMKTELKKRELTA